VPFPWIVSEKKALGYGYGASSELMLPGLTSGGVGTGAEPRWAATVEDAIKRTLAIIRAKGLFIMRRSVSHVAYVESAFRLAGC